MRCLLAAIACHALSPQQRCIHRREAPQQRRIHRREALRGVAALVAAAPGIAVASTNNTSPTAPRAINASTPRANVSEALSKNKMVVKQRKNLLVENVVDPASGEVLEEFRLPPWWPKRLRPPRRLARGVSNAELALAGFAAGGLTEVARVAALHPLSTVKTRSQGNFEGDDIFADLYAGAGPSIAAAAPAAATYYLVRDIAKRAVAEGPRADWDKLLVAVGVAAVASAASIAVRAPADVLAARAQLSGAESSIGDALDVGRRRYPTLVATEVPYSLLRLVGVALLDAEFPPTGRGVGVASARTAVVAAVAALATTPLDVVRTRALLATASNERAPGVVGALRGIAAAEGGDALFAGAAARVLYNGIVVAAVIPLRSLFYTGLRDALILDGIFEFDA